MDMQELDVFEIDGEKTLPLYLGRALTMEEIAPMSCGKCKIIYGVPDYEEPEYVMNESAMHEFSNNFDKAIQIVCRWPMHLSTILNYAQYEEDKDRNQLHNLHVHTQMVSAICDSRLGLDSNPLWELLREALFFCNLHLKYRSEKDKASIWKKYANELASVWNRLEPLQSQCNVLCKRMSNQLKLKRFEQDEIVPKSRIQQGLTKITEGRIRVFYSYCHKDEKLRDELEAHLASLRRQGYIESWHDRKIGGGNEWENAIDKNLDEAHIILLLVSSDFLASDYCYDIEMKRAIKKHESGEARVIPVILRSCDWASSPFGKLQAMPCDAMAVTSWDNRDEAFTDVAKEIRSVVGELRSDDSAL